LQSFNNLIRIEPQVRHLNSNARIFYHVLCTKNYRDSESFYRYAYASTQGTFTEYLRQLVSKYEKHNIEYLKAITDVSNSFDEVFSSIKGRSLLIFQRDSEAAEALEWCRLHRKKVPDTIAIIGLNNNPRFFHLGITTCVPDWRSIGYLMAHTILRDIPVEKTTRGYIRTRVRMYERMTTP
jgi:DNA-binding LacI/PurR family transcriptional regulator